MLARQKQSYGWINGCGMRVFSKPEAPPAKPFRQGVSGWMVR